jgi:hypothetical protein
VNGHFGKFTGARSPLAGRGHVEYLSQVHRISKAVLRRRKITGLGNHNKEEKGEEKKESRRKKLERRL